MDVVEHRAACVGDVSRVHQASCEHPHKPGVNGAKEQFSRLGALAGTGHAVKDPANLAGREVRVGEKACLPLDHLTRLRRSAELLHEVCRATTLPDNGVVDGLSGGGVPHDGGLALVVDTYGVDVCCGETALGEKLCERAKLRVENVLRVVLNPARLGEDLLEGSLHAVDHAALAVDEHGAAGGGALVERDDVLLACHG